MLNSIAKRYPRTIELEDGAKLTFSLMSPEDGEALAKFLARLTSYDLSYLQVDISRPDIQKHWLEGMARGDSVCVRANDPAGLVGYASVQMTDHARSPMGEIRVNIGKGYRSRGLGRLLISEIFHIAEELSVEVLTARMMADQHGAKAAFQRLGFTRDQVLKDFVQDANGVSKDLLVMTSRPGGAG